MIFQPSLKRIALTFTAALAVLILAGVLGIYFYSLKGFIVSGVPYLGWKTAMHENPAFGSREEMLGKGSAAASFMMVTSFWHLRDSSQAGPAAKQVLEELPDKAATTLEDMARYAQELGYKVSIRSARWGMRSIVRQAGGKFPQPVIVEQDVSTAHPGKGKIFRVVVGVTPGARTVLVHDYVFGANYAIPAQDFIKMWRSPARFLIIEPVDKMVALSSTPEYNGYPENAITPVEVNLRTLWYIAHELSVHQRRFQPAIAAYKEIINHPDFAKNNLSRKDKVDIVISLMGLYWFLPDFQSLLALEPTIVELNHDLNGEEPGEPENWMAWYYLTDAYYVTGSSREKALQYVRRWLKQAPDSEAAQHYWKHLEFNLPPHTTAEEWASHDRN